MDVKNVSKDLEKNPHISRRVRDTLARLSGIRNPHRYSQLASDNLCGLSKEGLAGEPPLPTMYSMLAWWPPSEWLG